jgi:hypothetical protein
MNNIDKILNESNIERVDPRHEALQNREAFFSELDIVADIDGLVAVLTKYSYEDWEGQPATPIFMQETEEYAQTVPHDGLWVVDVTVPLNETLTALDDYKQGHLSEQQLYNALGMEYNAVGVMRRITGVEWDDDVQSKLFRGELPARGGDGETVEGVSSVPPKAIE